MLARLTLSIVIGSLFVGAVSRADVPPGWSPALAEAFAAYEQGEFRQAENLARALVASPDNRLSLDAETLASMALIRSESRSDWSDARGRLSALLQGAPHLGDRPDVRLALGVGHLALHESSSALENLARAEEGFARQGRTSKRLEALAALAEAWASHNEWSMTPAIFDEPTPTGVEGANAVRERRIRALRSTAAELSGADSALAAIDFALGSLLADSGARTEEGVALLRRVASRTPVDRTVAGANLALAGRLAAAGEVDEAIAMYDRVARADAGELTSAAERELRLLRDPGFEIDVPARLSPAASAGIVVRARNIETGAIEVRRLDVRPWLEAQRGQFIESALPEEGAVAASAAIAADAAAGRERVARLDDPMTEGSYVVIARGRGATGGEVVSKRLLIVGSLDAGLIIGRDAGLAFLGGPGAGEARLWMHGSLAPLVIAIEDGVAAFSLPPEARLLREGRWTCLVERQGALAVCRGTIPVDVERSALPVGVLLSLSPASPRVGEEIVAIGLLASPPARQSPGALLDVSLIDPAGLAIGAVVAPVDARGVFHARFRVTPEMAGKTIQAIVRQAGQTLDQLYKRPIVSVAPLDPPTARATIQMPQHIARLLGPVPVRLRTEWIGGGPVGGQLIELTTQAARWPTPTQEQVTVRESSRRETMPADGRRDLATNIGALNLPEGPKSVQLRLTSFAPDRRTVVARAPVLIAPERLYAWIEVDAERPTAGVGTHLSVGWFDAIGEVQSRPRLELEGPDGARLELALYESASGLRTAEWIPPCPGRYRALLHLGTAGGAERTTERAIDVAPAAQNSPQACVSLRAEAAGTAAERRVQLILKSLEAQTVFVVLVGADPLAAARVDLPAGLETTVDLPAPATGDRPLHAYAMRFEHGQPTVLASCEVSAAAARPLSLTETNSETILGGVKNFRASLTEGELRGATVVARLVDAQSAGRHFWTPPETAVDRTGGIPRLGLHGASLSGGPGDRKSAITLASAELFDPATVALLADETALWGDAARVDVPSCLFGPSIPVRQGLYRLEVLARLADGTIARGSRMIDTRRSVEMELEFPPTLDVGDRVTGVVRIDHRGDGASATLRLKAPDGLRILGAGASGAAGAPLVDGSVAVRLDARSTTKIDVELEAVSPARAMLRAELETADGRVSAAAPIRVINASPGTPATQAGERVRIQRRLYRLERPVEWDQVASRTQEVEHEVDRLPEFNRIPVSPSEPLAAGQQLLVEETIELPRFEGALDWEQRIPATCVTLNDAPRDFAVIGRLEERRVGWLRYTAPASAGATLMHNYVIVTARTGDCRFPAPTLRLGSRRVDVELNGTPDRFSVGR